MGILTLAGSRVGQEHPSLYWNFGREGEEELTKQSLH